MRLAFSDANTKAVVVAIEEVERVCGRLAAEYRIDCLGEGLKWVARGMPRARDYSAARSAIDRAGSRLRKIASGYRDRAGKDAEAGPTARWRGTKKFSPVDKGKLGAAVAEARAVIKEAETKLLRSAESSASRRVHYQRIARAVGSTTRILRS